VNDKKEYRNIVKGTAIFGGVQVFNILITMLRGKFVALFLGPAGMGVSALMTSTISIINTVSSLGLGMGAIRDISIANEKGNIEKISLVAKIFRRLVFVTGILGAIISITGSKYWSNLAFGANDYRIAFIILGAMVFFSALGSGETTLLQGTRHLKDLAKTSIFGSIFGLFIGVPMYYFWGTKGIAPAMTALAFVTFLTNRCYSRKIELTHVQISKTDMVKYAKSMVLLGITLTIAAILGQLTTYFINWFIRYKGGISDVGLYQAASSITTQYIGFVFAAMAVDYYPRLAAISNDNTAVRNAVNQQAEIVMLISVPIILVLMVSAPLVVSILLSDEFMAVIPVLRWMGFALFFKAASFSLGYISFAKGDKKIFFWLEGIIGNFSTIAWCTLGYAIWGYIGLGIAMLGSYVTYFVLISIVVYFKYQFRFDKRLLKVLCVLIVCCLIEFIFSLTITDFLLYGITSGTVLFSSCCYCYRELNKRINIIELIKIKLR